MDWRYGSGIECLLYKCKTLSLNPSPTKKKKKKREREKGIAVNILLFMKKRWRNVGFDIFV
jgi:hypothetical protein